MWRLTRVVALATESSGQASTGSAEDVIKGSYPLDRYVFLFVRREPPQPLDPFVCEYLHIALSREGQQIVAAEPNGFWPLNANEVAEELAKLQ
jgi:phosphate transport system substrate-binding protein